MTFYNPMLYCIENLIQKLTKSYEGLIDGNNYNNMAIFMSRLVSFSK